MSEDEGKVYVGNLSFGTTEDEIRAEFEEFGQISDVTVIVDRETGRSRGFGFVTFYDKASATAAIESPKTIELGRRTLKVQSATKRGQGRRGGGGSYGGSGGGRYDQGYGGGGGGYGGQRNYGGQRDYGGQRGYGGGNRYGGGGGGGYGDGYGDGGQW